MVAGGVVDEEKLEAPIARHDWMSDEQYRLYREMVRLSRASFAALVARDRETWLKLSLRQRDLNRLANDKLFK